MIRPNRPSPLMLVLALALASCAPGRLPHPRLVEFGWDEPDTAWLRARLPEVQDVPFDGLVFHVEYREAGGARGNTAWQAWGRRAFRPEEVAAAREDLRAARWGHLRHSFLRLNTAPGDVDWFEDWDPILGNARLLAGLAREAGVEGLVLDVESYQWPLFEYARQPQRGQRSWAQYAGQARQRGREVMHAVRGSCPDCVVLLTFGATLPLAQSEGGRRPLAETTYGLLAPFVDGLAQEAGPGQLVDGYELSYGFRDPARFTEAARAIREGVQPLFLQPARYRQAVRAGFGLWLDYEWRRNGWHPEEPDRNYFTPAGLEAALAGALRASDGYVWLYGETPRWFNPTGGPTRVPPVYVEAIRRARAAGGALPLP